MKSAACSDAAKPENAGAQGPVKAPNKDAQSKAAAKGSKADFVTVWCCAEPGNRRRAEPHWRKMQSTKTPRLEERRKRIKRWTLEATSGNSHWACSAE